MKCPIDDTELSMTDRQGIEIDYCSKCRGVWLDRGELDKIIERSASLEGDNRMSNTQQSHYQEPQSNSTPRDGHYAEHQHGKKHKKEGFLGDLFDF